jgi:hypothetical protein
MPVTVNPYNKTLTRFASGQNVAGDEYKLILCTAATYNITHEVLGDLTYTEVANGNGYTTGGKVLESVVFNQVDTGTGSLDGCSFDADDVIWFATGAGISASHGILVNSTDANTPVLLFVDFGGTVTAADTQEFRITWSSNGIIRWSRVI